MKVLLVNPSDRNEVSPRLPRSVYGLRGLVPPLGLAYLAAMLEKNGHDVSMLDLRLAGHPLARLRHRLAGDKPDLVGITAMTPIFHNALSAAVLAKKSGAVVVVGGSQVAALPEETMSHDCFDYAILGEGEDAIISLAKLLEKKTRPANATGLIARHGNEIRVSEPGIVQDLDALPFPACRLLPMGAYRNVLEPADRIYTMVTSRGCPHHCSFCFKQPQDKHLRFRSAANVLDEIEHAIGQFAATEIMFYDDNITLKREHIAGICEEIIRRNVRIKWEAPSRMEHIDPALLRLMKRSGCLRLRYGVESGSESTLKKMGKAISLGRAVEVFRQTHEAGIRPFAYFIIGYLDETEEDIRRTIDFACSLGAESVMFNIAVPYPRTPLFDEAAAKGLVDAQYWSEYTLGGRPRHLPPLVPGADRWTAAAYRRFYLRPAQIFRNVEILMTPDGVRSALRAVGALLSRRT